MNSMRLIPKEVYIGLESKGPILSNITELGQVRCSPEVGEHTSHDLEEISVTSHRVRHTPHWHGCVSPGKLDKTGSLISLEGSQRD